MSLEISLSLPDFVGADFLLRFPVHKNQVSSYSSKITTHLFAVRKTISDQTLFDYSVNLLGLHAAEMGTEGRTVKKVTVFEGKMEDSKRSRAAQREGVQLCTYTYMMHGGARNFGWPDQNYFAELSIDGASILDY